MMKPARVRTWKEKKIFFHFFIFIFLIFLKHYKKKPSSLFQPQETGTGIEKEEEIMKK